MFKHKTRPISFALVVDDFFVKYVGKEHADHLMKCLCLLYVVKTDWNASLFLGIMMNWNYTQSTVDMSMPNYIEQALIIYMAGVRHTKQNSPHQHQTTTYGAKVQYTTSPDESPPLNKAGIHRLQQVIGTLLYYARTRHNEKKNLSSIQLFYGNKSHPLSESNFFHTVAEPSTRNVLTKADSNMK